MGSTVSDIGEDALVRRLTASLPCDARVLAGPGDDCAVVVRPGHDLLLKADAVVEGIHFTRETAPELIGRKALARALSDIAAAGGVPRHALITLVLPADASVDRVERIYAGMIALAREHGVNVVGGETSRGSQLVISVTIVGEATHGPPVGRSGALPGDALMVTGRLGGSIRGRHLSFEPRLEQSSWLLRLFRPHAMMDLSDGLAKDLPRLAAASGVEFIIDESALPCAEGCTPAQAWGDGEDYELLFTIDAALVESLMRHWRQTFPDLELTRIGSITAKGEGRTPGFATQGWEHFRSELKSTERA